LLINWLRDISLQQGVWSLGRASLTLTFQKEVAERIVALAGTSQRCRLSVMSQIWTKPEFRFTISGSAFVPKPDVDVGVVTFVPYKTPITDFDFDLVEKVVRHIFSMRQKYCRRGVATLFPEDVRDEFTELIFNLADVDPMIRPFQLSNEEYLRIIGGYKQVIQQHPQYEHYNFRACKKDLQEFLQQLEVSKLSNT
jgi:dimethyladenosine transferase 1, mitochondrial